MQGECTRSCCTVAGDRPTSVLFAIFSITYWGTWMWGLSEQKINQHFGLLFCCYEEHIHTLTQCLSCSWKTSTTPLVPTLFHPSPRTKQSLVLFPLFVLSLLLALLLPPMFEPPSYLFEIYSIYTSKCKKKIKKFLYILSLCPLFNV